MAIQTTGLRKIARGEGFVSGVLEFRGPVLVRKGSLHEFVHRAIERGGDVGAARSSSALSFYVSLWR